MFPSCHLIRRKTFSTLTRISRYASTSPRTRSPAQNLRYPSSSRSPGHDQFPLPNHTTSTDNTHNSLVPSDDALSPEATARMYGNILSQNPREPRPETKGPKPRHSSRPSTSSIRPTKDTISATQYFRIRSKSLDQLVYCSSQTTFSILKELSQQASAESKVPRGRDGRALSEVVISDMLTAHRLTEGQRLSLISSICRAIRSSAMTHTAVLMMVESLLCNSDGPLLLSEVKPQSKLMRNRRLPEEGLLHSFIQKTVLEMPPSSLHDALDRESEVRLTQQLHPFVVKQLKQVEERSPSRWDSTPAQPWSKFKAWSYSPPLTLDMVFLWIQKLLSVKRSFICIPFDTNDDIRKNIQALDAQAMELFQMLIEMEFVPRQDITDVDFLLQTSSSPTDLSSLLTRIDQFTLVIFTSLIRASIRWNRNCLALQLLRFLLRVFAQEDAPKDVLIESRNSWILGYLHRFAVDAVHTCIEDTPSRQELAEAGSVIQSLHALAFSPFAPSDAEKNVAPDNLVHLFYAKSCLPQSQTEVNPSKHPSDAAPAAARELYVFTRSPAISQQHWYPTPKGHAAVGVMKYLLRYGLKADTRSSSNATANPMYTHFARVLANEVASWKIDLPLDGRATFISLCLRANIAHPARAIWERYANGTEGEYVQANPGLMVRMVSAFMYLHRRWSDELADLSGKETLDAPEREKNSADVLAFAQRVLQDFISFNSPLSSAGHFELNAISRAYFILGDHQNGFGTLKIVLDSDSMHLDVTDLNIAIAFLAEHSPRTAARMIHRMRERGVNPDRYTFGPVIHWAMLYGDFDLVTDLLHIAKDVPSEHSSEGVKLTVKTQASLARGLVNPNLPLVGKYDHQNGDRAERRERLLGALTSLESIETLPGPMGKQFVFSSLQLKEPYIAYLFWKQLLKKTEAWEDREQVFMRRLIVDMLRSRRVWDRSGKPLRPHEIDNIVRELTGLS